MSEGIILPSNDDENQEEQEELKYEATERDEEEFFLMYNLNFQPSEVRALDEDYRKWLCARLVAQKHMEHEMMQRQRLAAQIMPNIRGT